MKTNQMFMNKLIDESIMVYPYNRILFGNRWVNNFLMLQHAYILFLRFGEYVTLQSRKKRKKNWKKTLCKCDYVKDTKMRQLKITEMGNYLWLSRWVKCSCRGPYKWKKEVGMSESEEMWWQKKAMCGRKGAFKNCIKFYLRNRFSETFVYWGPLKRCHV